MADEQRVIVFGALPTSKHLLVHVEKNVIQAALVSSRLRIEKE